MGGVLGERRRGRSKLWRWHTQPCVCFAGLEWYFFKNEVYVRRVRVCLSSLGVSEWLLSVFVFSRIRASFLCERCTCTAVSALEGLSEFGSGKANVNLGGWENKLYEGSLTTISLLSWSQTFSVNSLLHCCLRPAEPAVAVAAADEL